ncbi:MAG TPA: histidine phosphatase family protein [Gaiellaceae bacterium]|nr:histidine phosphatase family protein [Gaiellaceae bacterium]
MRLFLLARHGQSTLNVERRINGDPAVDVPLTADGTANALRLAAEIAALPVELGVHTRFARTRRTLEIALGKRGVPLLELPLLDDVRVGELEGCTIEEYRAWKQGRPSSEPFPGGESLDDAARRYAEGYEQLLARPERVVLVVCHEIAVRYAVNGAAGSATLDGPLHDVPNALPYLFDEESLARAVDGIRHAAAA